MRGIAVALAASLILASCVQAAGDESTEDGSPPDNVDPVAPKDVDPDSDFGIVQGTIVNEEAQPIAGAQVALAKTDFETTTDAKGVFVFREVWPGEYALLVGALGYEATGRSIKVTAAQITSVSLILKTVEIQSDVFYVVFHYTGFFECAVASNFWVSSCSYPYTNVWGTAKNNGVNLSNYGAPQDIQRNIHRFNFTVKTGVGEVIGELVWQPASAAATRMMLLFLCGDYDYFWDDCVYPPGSSSSIRYGPGSGTSGTSPVRSVVPGKEFVDKGKGKGKWDLAKTGEIWVMNYVGLPFGNPQVAFQQKFDVYDSVFYNGPGPEGWSVLPPGG